MNAPALREHAHHMVRAAQAYIALIWPVFVLSPTKTPVANCDQCRAEHTTPDQMEACTCLMCHGFYAATLDLDRFAEMVRLHPHGLLAIRTGAVSGTVVVDVDGAQGIATMRGLMADGLLPRTIAQGSGGGGYHLVYAHPGGRILSGARKGGPGVDIKADDAYVIVSPSVHPRTRQPYRWLTPPSTALTPLPQALVHYLQEVERPRRAADAGRPLPGRPGSPYAEAALRRELERVLAAAEGTRNETLAKKAAFSLGQLVAAGALDSERTAILLERAGKRIGLKPGETRRAIASGFRAGALHPRGGAA